MEKSKERSQWLFLQPPCLRIDDPDVFCFLSLLPGPVSGRRVRSLV
ncbi:hypothetical protein [Liberibacter crescens]|nr:hypothetical protein [Liberibacter crescens]